MAEVTRVLGRMQLDTEGGLVPASGSEGLVLESSSVPLYSRRRSMLVKDDSAAVSRNKGELGKREGAEIGVTKAELGNKEVAGCFTGEIGVTKAELGNKEVAGSLTGEIGVIKAGEIGVIKAELGNKEAVGSLTGEIGVTKAELGNKEAAGTGMVKVASCIEEDFVICSTHPAAAGSDIKEKVPQAFIESIKAHPVRRPPATLPERFRDNELILSCNARINTMIDLYEDCVRQYEQKGYAEVGVAFTDAGKLEDISS